MPTVRPASVASRIPIPGAALPSFSSKYVARVGSLNSVTTIPATLRPGNLTLIPTGLA